MATISYPLSGDAGGRRILKLTNDISCLVAGAGPAVLLLHGSAGSWTHWARNIDALARDYEVFALDLPGFGFSGGVPADVSVDAYIERVSGILADFPEQPLRMVGFSFGGQIAAGVAAKWGTAVYRLSLIAPSGFEAPIGRVLGRKKSPATSAAEPGRDEHARDVHRHNLLALMLSQPSTITEETIDLQIENLAASRFNNTRAISHSGRILEFLAAARYPVQILYGADDKTPFPSAADRISRCRSVLPSLQAEIIDGAGHWVQYEQAERTNALLASFLN